MQSRFIQSLIFITATILAPSFASALNVCTMTFNSADEKLAFSHIYKQYPQAKIIELVPDNGHAQWLKKSCENKTKCDILLISGHFGGLFFGENKLATMSMDEMFERSCQQDCPGIFENVKSVYLMGCNTLASKKRDHRNIETYLRVLVNDGFPLQNAELVATSRYAEFGEDIESQMQMIFPKAEFIFGFDSTGPLGKKAGPLLSRALLSSSKNDHLRTGATAASLNHFFKRLNARTVFPSKNSFSQRQSRCEALTQETSPAKLTPLFNTQNLRKNFDVALKMSDRQGLRELLTNQTDLQNDFVQIADEVLAESQKLLGIQKLTHDLLIDLDLTTPQEYQKNIRALFQKNLNFLEMDYIRTEQLCSIISSSGKILGSASQWKLPAPDFNSYPGVLSYCFTKSRSGTKNHLEQATTTTAVGQCLLNNIEVWQDWDCLTTHKEQLDLSSCLFAANRNPDLENGDNMRWFCYDHLSKSQQLKAPACLVLSKSFQILGNQIKSNWNCMNRL